MKKISKEIASLLESKGFVIVSTLDKDGNIHCSAKGVVEVEEEGKVYLIDLYKRVTYANLQRNSTVSITVIDEEQFAGFNLKGKASIVQKKDMEDKFIKKWQKEIIRRISKRVIKNIKKDKKSKKLPETNFPQPEYLIEIKVGQIVDLAPSPLKKPALDD